MIEILKKLKGLLRGYWVHFNLTGWGKFQIVLDKLSNSKPTGIIIIEESKYRLKKLWFL